MPNVISEKSCSYETNHYNVGSKFYSLTLSLMKKNISKINGQQLHSIGNEGRLKDERAEVKF